MSNIAKEIYLSEKYMYRLFLERYNISPKQFLIKTRMEKAHELLQKNNLTVTEVSKAVGYDSISVFSKTFTNYFGVSPSSSRKQRWCLKKARGYYPPAFLRYATVCIGICAAFSMFSINIPYPVVGSFTRTWVTAPTSFPSWMIGEPDRSVVKKGQQNHSKKCFSTSAQM